MNEIPHPPIVSQQEWLTERKKLLAEEKQLTKRYDELNAKRRRLPLLPGSDSALGTWASG